MSAQKLCQSWDFVLLNLTFQKKGENLEVKFPITLYYTSFSRIQIFHLIHQYTKARGNCGTSQASQFLGEFTYSKVVKNGHFGHFRVNRPTLTYNLGAKKQFLYQKISKSLPQHII